MAKSARQAVFEGMELLPEALVPFVEKRFETQVKGHWKVEVSNRLRLRLTKGAIAWDQAALLNAMDRYWNEAFRSVLGRAERAIVNELIDVRNKLAHNERFTYDDAERALDSIRRLVEAIGASATGEQLSKMRETILRTKFQELRRTEERRQTRATPILVDTVGGLKPWREVVQPHDDVATGDFRKAEFAADLAKVHKGVAPDEYRDPQEFFSRTYLTEGLSTLLVGAAKRLSDEGGDPVVELQTNFGGGKTHSMLALYHMSGGTPVRDLAGLDQLLSEYSVTVPDGIKRAVIVGTSRSPIDTLALKDGPEIRTTWGEMAWQLGGAEGYELIADHDAQGIAPGSDLLESLFRKHSPCLILIDEWVAYLRQIYKTDGLPAGSFDSNLTFVQSLTEAVKASPRTLLVAALPASQIEVGGEGGSEALTRLQQTFSRVESSWSPASQEESYEIVRRRLFKEIPGNLCPHRDNTLKQFAKLYRDNPNEFPRGSADVDYRNKMETAYPVHPELFDQLYTTWGSLERFQRTRGVLRLMAQVVHELWMNNDPSVMIMPGSIAVGSERVEPELRHYLDDSWRSIIAGDVDGATSVPYRIDQDNPNLNRYSATRRVARAIFLGTAPLGAQQNRGMDDKRINLGIVQPGERPMIFGDALRRLGNHARFLHGDMDRYWYSMSPSLNREAADRAEQLEEALVAVEIDKELGKYVNGLRDRGHFEAFQVAPGNLADIPDESGGVRAVVLGVAHPHKPKNGSNALKFAQEALMNRGTTPRVNRNMLVFLAADARQARVLNNSMRTSLAWAAIVQDTERLNLTQSDSALAKSKLAEAEETLRVCIKETWCYLLYPAQDGAEEEVYWISTKVPVQDGILARASKRLANDEALLTTLGPVRLDRELQRYIWQGKDHLHLKDLWEYLNRYTYLPRLKSRDVLANCVKTSVGELVAGPFAYAEGWDEKAGRFLGLLTNNAGEARVLIDSDSLIVTTEAAERQIEAERERAEAKETSKPGSGSEPDDPSPPPDPTNEPESTKPTRFIGRVAVSSDRPARDIHKIVEGIVEQLTVIPGSSVSLALDIDAEVPDGLDTGKVRTLVENAQTLGFSEKTIR